VAEQQREGQIREGISVRIRREARRPNEWKSHANQYFQVEELPHLGTGKLDLRRVHELAAELSPMGE
jgi:hypothetical protein